MKALGVGNLPGKLLAAKSKPQASTRRPTNSRQALRQSLQSDTKEGRSAKRVAFIEGCHPTPRDLFRAECNFARSGSGLQDSGAEFQAVCKESQALPSWEEEVGRQFLHISERALRARERRWRCNKVSRGFGGQRARLFRQGEPPPVQTVLAGMASFGPRSHSPTNAVGVDSSHCHEVSAAGSDRPRPSGSLDVRRLPEARGSAGVETRGPGVADSTASILLPEPSPIRQIGMLKDGNVRRDHTPGFTDDSMDGSALEASSQSAQKREDVSCRLQRPSRRMARLTGKLRALQDTFSSLSAQAQWSIIRQDDKTTQSFGGQKERALVVGQFREAIRGQRPTQPGIPEATTIGATASNTSSKPGAAVGPKILLPEASKDRRIWVLEIFSGSAHLSKALVQQGFRCAAWGIEYNEHCDVLNSVVLRQLLSFLVMRRVVLVWFGMPCQSWSRARRFDGGPPPLRDDHDFIWGRKQLGHGDMSKIHLGNLLLFWTVFMAQICSSLQIPWVIENPGSSRCWLTPDFGILQQTAQLFFVDYCQYRMPWRKNTGLLTCDFPELGTILRTCKSHLGRCSATHRKHIVLTGKDSNQVWWTHRAHPYPPLLCHEIAATLASAQSCGVGMSNA